METFASGPKSLRKLSNCCKHGSDIHVLKMAPVLLEVGLEGPRVEERREARERGVYPRGGKGGMGRC